MSFQRQDANRFLPWRRRGWTAWRVSLFACFLFGLGGAVMSAQPAASGFRSVDLSGHFNVSNGPPSKAVFPQGAQTLGGVPFVLGGRVQVTGLDATRNGELQPAQITGVHVGQKAARLHLLHGALHGVKDGVPLANLVLHFANGETRVLRLAFGVHARNVVVTEEESTAALADGNSSLVWPAGTPGRNDSSARLYHTVLANPLPDAEIATLDFVSLFGRATPVLFAVTLQMGGDLAPLAAPAKPRIFQRAREFPDTAYRRDIKVRVVDVETSRAFTNATVMVTVQDDARPFFFGEHHADGAGETLVSFPPQFAASLSLRAASPGFVAATRTLSSLGAGTWPDVIELQLGRGQGIGGLVVDRANKPIAGARVLPYEITQTASNLFTREDFEPAQTGVDGHWRATVDGGAATNLYLEITHPEYQPMTDKRLHPSWLTSGTYKNILDPEDRVAGRIVNEAGNPIENATVILDYGVSNYVVRYTDAKGEFAFLVRDAPDYSAKVIAFAASYAPVMRPVTIDAEKPVGDIALKSGSTFRMKMADARGRPVEGVSVKLVTWNGSKAMSWATKTDREGRFRWDHAPEGQLIFEYDKTGFSRYTHSVTLPMAGELNYTYSQPVRVAGRVIDAESKKPIDQLRVMIRYNYKNGGGSTSTSSRNGVFNTMLGSGPYEEIKVSLEAKGYEPLLETLPVAEGSYSNVFEMHRARLISLAITAADGSPAAGAEVVLLDRTKSGYMDDPGKFRRSATVYEIAIADAQGRAELTPRLDADLVLATHPQWGFAEVPLMQATNSSKIALKPWGYIKGTLRVGDKVEPFHSIALRTVFSRAAGDPRTSAPFYIYRDVKPAADGSFEIEMVPPGTRSVSLLYKLGNRPGATPKLSHAVVVDVEPGSTNTIIIGGPGRTVVGKVDLAGIAPGSVDWQRDTHILLRQPSSRIPPPLRYPPNATPQERARLLAERTAQLQAMNRAQVRENLIERTYAVLFEDDGSFRIPNVPPGAYYLSIHPTDARTPNSFRQIGTSNQEVIVGEGTAPLDVGMVKLRMN